MRKDDYQDKSVDSSRIGKAVEHLVAATCILASNGQLNASTSMVDDEGVDLIFHRRGNSATLAVQVKSRTYASIRVRRGSFLTEVRTQTFRARPELFMLFVAVDCANGVFDPVWLIPSLEFEGRALRTGNGMLRMTASMKDNSKDKWSGFRMKRNELSGRIFGVLEKL